MAARICPTERITSFRRVLCTAKTCSTAPRTLALQGITRTAQCRQPVVHVEKPRCVLAQDGEWLRAGLNVAGSVVLCLLAVWLGYLAGAVVNL